MIIYTPLGNGRCKVQQKTDKNGMSNCPITDVRDGKCPDISSKYMGRKGAPYCARIGMKRMPHRRMCEIE